MAQLGGGGGGGGESVLSLVSLVPLTSPGSGRDSDLDLLSGAGVRLRLQTQVGHPSRPAQSSWRLPLILTTQIATEL